MRRFRLLTAIFAALTAVVLVVSQADARVGGGSSFGSRGTRTYSAPPSTTTAPRTAAPIERSMTQPTRPNVGTPATGGLFGGFFNRPGLLGGLAAGFLGAGLFGLLFGHGLFGGMGGFASFLGLLLQIGLIVIVARLIFAWWQRRNAPAYASAGMSPQPSSGSYFGYTGATPGSTTPGTENVAVGKEDYDAFERLLGDIQSAYGAEDLNALRARVTPEMLSYFAEELANNSSRGVVNHVSDVKLLQGDLAEAWREGATEYATVAMRFSLVDRTVERSSGRLVDGSDQPVEVTELWTFMRARGGDWLLSAIQQS